MTDKFISAADGCFYAQQQRNGTWVIGGDSNYEIYDATYPREVTFSFSAPRIARFFLEYMPTLKGVKVIRSWSGQLDMCWDGSPVISPWWKRSRASMWAVHSPDMASGSALRRDMCWPRWLWERRLPPICPGLRYDRFRLPSH